MTELSVVLASGEPAPVILMILLFLVVGWILIGISNARRKAMKVVLQRVASRVGGSVAEGTWLSEPSLSCAIAGRGARIEFFAGSKNSSPYSQVVVDVRGLSPGSLHILKSGFGQEFLKVFGAQDLVVGDPAFDRDYVIKATPDSLARRLFSRERQREGIRAVRQLQTYDHPTFDLNSQSVTVKVRAYLREEGQLLTLIDAAKQFVAFLLEPAAPSGIVLGEVKLAAGGECPVCGTELRDLVLRCEACRTPHHSECWQYMGRCSTYACKGMRGVA